MPNSTIFITSLQIELAGTCQTDPKDSKRKYLKTINPAGCSIGTAVILNSQWTCSGENIWQLHCCGNKKYTYGKRSFSYVAAGLEFLESVLAHCCNNTIFFKGFQRSVCANTFPYHNRSWDAFEASWILDLDCVHSYCLSGDKSRSEFKMMQKLKPAVCNRNNTSIPTAID